MGSDKRFSITLPRLGAPAPLFSALHVEHADKIQLDILLGATETRVDWYEYDGRNQLLREGHTAWDRQLTDQKRLLGDGMIDLSRVIKHTPSVPAHIPIHRILGLFQSALNGLVVRGSDEAEPIIDQMLSELTQGVGATAKALEVKLNENLPARPFRVLAGMISSNPPQSMHPGDPLLRVYYYPLDIASFSHDNTRYAVTVSESQGGFPGAFDAAAAAFEQNFRHLPGYVAARTIGRQIVAYFDLSRVPQLRREIRVQDDYYQGIPLLLGDPTQQTSTGTVLGGFGQDPLVFPPTGGPVQSMGRAGARPDFPLVKEPVEEDPAEPGKVLLTEEAMRAAFHTLRDNIFYATSGAADTPFTVTPSIDPLEWRLTLRGSEEYASCTKINSPGATCAYQIELNDSPTTQTAMHGGFVSYLLTSGRWSMAFNAWTNRVQPPFVRQGNSAPVLEWLQTRIYEWIAAKTGGTVIAAPATLVNWPAVASPSEVEAALARLTSVLVARATRRSWNQQFAYAPESYRLTLANTRAFIVTDKNAVTTYRFEIDGAVVAMVIDRSKAPITIEFKDPNDLWKMRGRMGDPTTPVESFQDFQILAIKLFEGRL